MELHREWNPSKAEADYGNGVLSIRVPLREEAKPVCSQYSSAEVARGRGDYLGTVVGAFAFLASFLAFFSFAVSLARFVFSVRFLS